MRMNTNHVEGFWLEECLFLIVLSIQVGFAVVHDAATQGNMLRDLRNEV